MLWSESKGATAVALGRRGLIRVLAKDLYNSSVEIYDTKAVSGFGAFYAINNEVILEADLMTAGRILSSSLVTLTSDLSVTRGGTATIPAVATVASNLQVKSQLSANVKAATTVLGWLEVAVRLGDIGIGVTPVKVKHNVSHLFYADSTGVYVYAKDTMELLSWVTMANVTDIAFNDHGLFMAVTGIGVRYVPFFNLLVAGDRTVFAPIQFSTATTPAIQSNAVTSLAGYGTALAVGSSAGLDFIPDTDLTTVYGMTTTGVTDCSLSGTHLSYIVSSVAYAILTPVANFTLDPADRSFLKEKISDNITSLPVPANTLGKCRIVGNGSQLVVLGATYTELFTINGDGSLTSTDYQAVGGSDREAINNLIIDGFGGSCGVRIGTIVGTTFTFASTVYGTGYSKSGRMGVGANGAVVSMATTTNNTFLANGLHLTDGQIALKFNIVDGVATFGGIGDVYRGITVMYGSNSTSFFGVCTSTSIGQYCSLSSNNDCSSEYFHFPARNGFALKENGFFVGSVFIALETAGFYAELSVYTFAGAQPSSSGGVTLGRQRSLYKINDRWEHYEYNISYINSHIVIFVTTSDDDTGELLAPTVTRLFTHSGTTVTEVVNGSIDFITNGAPSGMFDRGNNLGTKAVLTVLDQTAGVDANLPQVYDFATGTVQAYGTANTVELTDDALILGADTGIFEEAPPGDPFLLRDLRLLGGPTNVVALDVAESGTITYGVDDLAGTAFVDFLEV